MKHDPLYLFVYLVLLVLIGTVLWLAGVIIRRTTSATALMIVLTLLGTLVAIVLPVWAIPLFLIAWLLGSGALVERIFRTGPDD